LCNSAPFYDTEDEYYVKSYFELEAILDKVGMAELKNFINSICNIKVMGFVDAELMLRQIHQFSTNQDRIIAFNDYKKWLKSQKYTHLQTNDIGDLERVQCTRYIAHSEFGADSQPQVEYMKYDKKTRTTNVYIQKYQNVDEKEYFEIAKEKDI